MSFIERILLVLNTILLLFIAIVCMMIDNRFVNVLTIITHPEIKDIPVNACKADDLVIGSEVYYKNEKYAVSSLSFRDYVYRKELSIDIEARKD